MNEYKECPFCSEQILARARKCKHCHSMLEEQPGPAGFPPPHVTSGPAPGGPPPHPMYHEDRAENTGLPVSPSGPPPEPVYPQKPPVREPVLKDGKGILLPALVVILILGFIAAAIVVAINFNTLFPGEKKQATEDPSPVPGPNGEVTDPGDKPDFGTLENAVEKWLEENLVSEVFFLFYEDDLPDIDTFYEMFTSEDTVLVYKLESAGDSDVTILVGIPFSEAFCRLTFQWRDRRWDMTGMEDLW